jgi:hypothetical protein
MGSFLTMLQCAGSPARVILPILACQLGESKKSNFAATKQKTLGWTAFCFIPLQPRQG